MLTVWTGCALNPGDPPLEVEGQSQAMINNGDDTIDCSNCVGGDCAYLQCFETWTHSGGGPQGPYYGRGNGKTPPPSGGGSTGSPEQRAPRPSSEDKCNTACVAGAKRCFQQCNRRPDDSDCISRCDEIWGACLIEC
jgi:hypothetical protein